MTVDGMAMRDPDRNTQAVGPQITRCFVELDGRRVSYLKAGDSAAGHPILLIHGSGVSAGCWVNQLRGLREALRMMAIDLPGHGESDSIRTAGVEEYADTVAKFLKVLGSGPVIVVGHSLGGAVAIAYASAYPADVERIALLGAVVPGFGYRLSWVYRLIALYGIGDLLSACAPAWVYRAAIGRCFAEPAPAEVAFLVDCAYAVRTSPEGRAAYLATLRGVRTDFVDHAEQYRKALRRLDVPVLAIHGRQDPVVPATHCADVVENCGRAAVHWLDRCGHFPQIEHAPAVNAWLAEFLVGRTAPR